MNDISVSENRVRLTECHDWAWSKMLWKRNDVLIFRIIIVNVLVYVALAYWTTNYDGLVGIDNMYLITATLTTVNSHYNVIFVDFLIL